MSLLPIERARQAKFPEGKKMTVEEVAKVVGPEFAEMNENPPEQVKKLREDMETTCLMTWTGRTPRGRQTTGIPKSLSSVTTREGIAESR